MTQQGSRESTSDVDGAGTFWPLHLDLADRRNSAVNVAVNGIGYHANERQNLHCQRTNL